MTQGFFITGTDTGVGKTTVTTTLMHYFKKQGHSVIGMKPIAAGCQWIDGQLKNEDALLLQKNASIQVDYKQINPYAFEMAVSPHLASKDETVQLEVIVKVFKQLQNKADVVIVEGAGGWLAPLNKTQTIADLAIVLEIPVILVVVIKLGCINHAQLTDFAIQSAGVKCAGWIAVCTEPEMDLLNENVAAIQDRLSVPLIGIFPYLTEINYDELATRVTL